MRILDILAQAAPPHPDVDFLSAALGTGAQVTISSALIALIGGFLKPVVTQAFSEYFADRRHKREMDALGMANDLAVANERLRNLEREGSLRKEQVESLQAEVALTRAEAEKAKADSEAAKAEAEAARAEMARIAAENAALKLDVEHSMVRLDEYRKHWKDPAPPPDPPRSSDEIPTFPPQVPNPFAKEPRTR